MILKLTRFSSGRDDTIGTLHDVTRDDGFTFLAFTLEDEYRTAKKYGETRIPAGDYILKLRKHGGFHVKYLARFSWHQGMLEIHDVPGFTDVLIHIGNTEEDTAGCILVGNSAHINHEGRGWVGESTDAYERVYKHIIPRLTDGEEVRLRIEDYA